MVIISPGHRCRAGGGAGSKIMGYRIPVMAASRHGRIRSARNTDRALLVRHRLDNITVRDIAWEFMTLGYTTRWPMSSDHRRALAVRLTCEPDAERPGGGSGARLFGLFASGWGG